MNRRMFLAAWAGGLLAAPLAAEAQQAWPTPCYAWSTTSSLTAPSIEKPVPTPTTVTIASASPGALQTLERQGYRVTLEPAA